MSAKFIELIIVYLIYKSRLIILDFAHLIHSLIIHIIVSITTITLYQLLLFQNLEIILLIIQTNTLHHLHACILQNLLLLINQMPIWKLFFFFFALFRIVLVAFNHPAFFCVLN